jgi:hypothetical protein
MRIVHGVIYGKCAQGRVMIARYGATTTTSATILIRFCALSGAACYDAICSDDILDYDLGTRNRCKTCDGTTTLLQWLCFAMLVGTCCLRTLLSSVQKTSSSLWPSLYTHVLGTYRDDCHLLSPKGIAQRGVEQDPINDSSSATTKIISAS